MIDNRFFQFYFIGLLIVVLMSAANARQGEPPTSWRKLGASLDNIPVTSLPAVNRQSLIAADEAIKGIAPLRFALPVTVAVTPSNHGSWEDLDDGGRLWRYRVHAAGATDLNFGFSHYRLPAGAMLYIYSETERYYEGPYDAADNKSHGQFWTPVVPGDKAVIELYLPADALAWSSEELRIVQIGSGYRDLLGRLPTIKQGSCNNDVICPEGDPWRDQIRSVARYTRNGAFLCTGSLVMDVPATFRPFFLTAAHCGVNAGNDSTVVVYWNFESPVCGQLSGGSLTDNQTGATFRATEADVDFTLLELDASPDPSANVFYAGWDRSENVPQGSVAIHHPSGDEKAISFNDDALTTGNSCIGGSTPDTHWYVDDWEDGTTEPGSSGSGLFEPANQRIVGFLSGGSASCGNPLGFDCYGKFSVAWDGASASSRLSDWLDPDDTGTLTVDGSDPGQLPQPTHYDFTMAEHSDTEGDTTNTTNVVEVFRSGDTSGAEQVTITLTGQTATADEDFTAGPVVINFANAQTSASVPIEILGDTTPESDETVQLSFSGFSAGGIVGSNQPTTQLTISNDDITIEDNIFDDQFE